MFTKLMASLPFLLAAATADAQHPLEPLDKSSPRATMKSLLALPQEWDRRYSEFRDSPSPTTENALLRLGQKARGLLDLSQVPPAARREVGGETLVLLLEVIARLELPDLAEIPDAPGDEKAEEPTPWRIPHTEIAIARAEKGPRAGEYLFSPDTVKRVQHFYEVTRHLPYVRPMPSESLIRTAQLLTGWMIPMAWVEALPSWANTPVLGQVVWKWFALLLLLGLAVGAVITVFRWARRRPLDASLGSYLRRLSTPLTILVLARLVRYLSWKQINLTGSAADTPDYLIVLASGVALVWLIWLTASWIAEAIIATPRIRPESLDASLIRLAGRSLGIIAVVVFVFRIGSDIGIPVYGLVAGAGVGGLAIALAARSTLENFIATFHLYADRPYRVGDWVIFGAKEGTVEAIGFRSTRIRTFYNSVVAIPNSEAISMTLDNMSTRTYRRVYTKVGIRYDTPPERIEAFLEGIKRIIQANPNTRKDYFHVVLHDFGPASFDVIVYFFLKVPDWARELVERQRVMLAIIRLADALNVEFAFPTQTLQIETFPGQPSPHPEAAVSDDDLRRIAADFGGGASARPGGLGIFVPPHEERTSKT